MVSIGEFLDAFGFENMLLIATFIISFVLLNFILDRVLKDRYGGPNKKVSGLISFAISMLIVYGINTLNFDIGDFFFNLGLEGEILTLIITIIVLTGIGILLWKVGILIFLIFGALLIIVSFTDWVYEKEIVLFTGIAFFILWMIIAIIKKKLKKPKIGPDPLSNSNNKINKSQKEAEKARKKYWDEQRKREASKTRQEDWTRKIEIQRARNQERTQREKEARRLTELTRDRKQQTQQQAQQREQTRRTTAELRQKYHAYSGMVSTITSKIGHIPAKGTPEYKQYYQYIRAMKAIEKLARKKGISL